jgi:hypothetical protein
LELLWAVHQNKEEGWYVGLPGIDNRTEKSRRWMKSSNYSHEMTAKALAKANVIHLDLSNALLNEFEIIKISQ